MSPSTSRSNWSCCVSSAGSKRSSCRPGWRVRVKSRRGAWIDALGTAQRKDAGEITNGVLLLQGNTWTGANWLRPSLADELFKDGQPLDAGRYFIIIPDALGRGG